MSGKLIVAGLDIGNPLDIPQRTIALISDSDNIIVSEKIENTIYHFASLGIEIKSQMIEYLPNYVNGVNLNNHVVGEICDAIVLGKTVVLISTEGMPLIHDPGYEIVLEARRRNLLVSVIPGPSAPIAALNVAGLDSWKFVFDSDIPTSGIQRSKLFSDISNRDITTILFEKDYLLLESLENMLSFIEPSRPIAICIDITMPTEKIIRLSLKDAHRWWFENKIIGDYEEQVKIVLVISGKGY